MQHLHENVYYELCSYIKDKHLQMITLRAPNTYRRYPKCKVCILAKEDIASAVEQHIQLIYSKYGLTANYQVRQYHALGAVSVNKQAAYTQVACLGNQLEETIERLCYTYQDTEQRTRLKITIKELESAHKLSPEERYWVICQTGISYRLSYFDTDSQRRKQCSCGDVSIFVGDPVYQTEAEPRKRREDARDASKAILQLSDVEVYSYMR